MSDEELRLVSTRKESEFVCCEPVLSYGKAFYPIREQSKFINIYECGKEICGGFASKVYEYYESRVGAEIAARKLNENAKWISEAEDKLKNDPNG